MSLSAFSCTSTCPACTSWPERKFTLRTSPAISVVTSTPRTGTRLPTAFSCGCQLTFCAFIAVTVCGPGLGMLAISFWMCR